MGFPGEGRATSYCFIQFFQTVQCTGNGWDEILRGRGRKRVSKRVLINQFKQSFSKTYSFYMDKASDKKVP